MLIRGPACSVRAFGSQVEQVVLQYTLFFVST